MDLPKQLQCNFTSIVNMGHIQTYASVPRTLELDRRLKQDREKWHAVFRTCIKLFPPTPVYVCINYISGHKWSTTHSAHLRHTVLIYDTQCSSTTHSAHLRHTVLIYDTQCSSTTHSAHLRHTVLIYDTQCSSTTHSAHLPHTVLIYDTQCSNLIEARQA